VGRPGGRGKRAFGSLMLGAILKGGINPSQTFVFGASFAMLSFAVGIWFISISGE
jgi:hypothetical protein